MRAEPLEDDVIIVGSGPGGAAAALAMAKSGLSVQILERGGSGAPGDGLLSLVLAADDVSVGDELGAMRVFAPGGTSTICFGVGAPPQSASFRRHGVDLTPHWDALRLRYSAHELDDKYLSPKSLFLRDAAHDMGYAWSKVPMMVDIRNELGVGQTVRRWDAGRVLRDAVAAGARLTFRQRVLRVLTESGQAVGVEIEDRRGGIRRRRRAFAKRIVIAAGAFATPEILRSSGIRPDPSRTFFCNPSVAVFASVDKAPAGQGVGSAMQADLGNGLTIGDANVSAAYFRLFALAAGRPSRWWARRRCIGIGAIVKEPSSGRWTADGRFEKDLTPWERDRLDDGRRHARRLIERVKGRIEFEAPVGAAYVGGLFALGQFVDADLQSELRGLHICDATVIPDDARVSPVITLMCLGTYLGARLATVIGRRERVPATT